MSSEAPMCVQRRDGWCLLKLGAQLDSTATKDPTACGYVVILRKGDRRREPTCPECRAIRRELAQQHERGETPREEEAR